MLNNQNLEIKNIIDFYRNLSDIVFKFWIYFLIWVISILFLSIINFDSKKVFSFRYKSDSYLTNLSNNLKWDIFSYDNKRRVNWLDLEILRWNFSYSWNSISSYNNLLVYSWFILPFKFSTSKKIDVKPYSSFLSWDYDINDINKYLSQFVLIKTEWVDSDIKEFNSLVLSEDGIKDFYQLSCISKINLIPFFCNKNIWIFTHNLHNYEILSNKDEFIDVFSNLIDSKYNKQICDWIINYVWYSYDTNDSIENIVSRCGQSYLDKYTKLKNYKDLSNQLHKDIYTDKVYNDNQLNSYKLVSLQNNIYMNLQKWIINNSLMEWYIAFINKLLRTNGIDPFYKDEIYVYNNSYLQKRLVALKWKYNLDISKKIDFFLDELSRINRWDYISSYKWLESELLNKNLLKLHSSADNRVVVQSVFSLKDYFDDYIKNFSFVTVLENKFDDSNKTVTIKAKIIIKWQLPDSENNTIYINILFVYNWSSLFVKAVKIDWNEYLTDLINQKLKSSQWILINDLYSILSNNIQLKWNIKVDNCILLKDILQKNFSSNESKVLLRSCSQDYIDILKNQITYKFTIKWLKLSEIDVSDKDIQNLVVSWYSNYKTISIDSLNDFVLWVLKLEKPKEKTSSDENINEIAKINDLFKKYLWVVPTDIKWNWVRYIIKFVLNDLTLRATLYTDKNYKLSITRIIDAWDNSIWSNLSWLNLYLIDSYKTDLNKFKEFTVDYIKWIDPKWYQEFIDSKK